MALSNIFLKAITHAAEHSTEWNHSVICSKCPSVAFIHPKECFSPTQAPPLAVFFFPQFTARREYDVLREINAVVFLAKRREKRLDESKHNEFPPYCPDNNASAFISMDL